MITLLLHHYSTNDAATTCAIFTNRNIKRSVCCHYGYSIYSLTFRALALRQRALRLCAIFSCVVYHAVTYGAYCHLLPVGLVPKRRNGIT